MLDPQGKASINAQIRKLHEEKNITILSITHDMEEVAQSENVIVLEMVRLRCREHQWIFLNRKIS